MTTQPRSSSRLVSLATIIYQALQEAGDAGIPNGHVYAQLMSAVTFDEYTQIIATLKQANLVQERFNVLHAIPLA